MANNKNKIKELVPDDDDPTAELEALSFEDDAPIESDANTFNIAPDDETAESPAISELRSDLRVRSETISRLQFDIEQLRARWLGLEAEIKSREEITSNLQQELDEHKEELSRKKSLLRESDDTIRHLKTEVREREDEYRELESSFNSLEAKFDEQCKIVDELRDSLAERDDSIAELHEQNGSLQSELSTFSEEEIEQTRETISMQAGQLASDRARILELEDQLSRSEQYADSIRQMLSDMLASNEDIEQTRTQMQGSINEANERIDELSGFLETATAKIADLTEQLAAKDADHAEEIRTLRFELGEAQETVATSETLNEQLASDLLEARGYKDDLERMITEHDEGAKEQIAELEKEVARLTSEVEDYEQQLETKADAINCLLDEIAKKSEQIDSIGEIEEAIHELDDRMSESIEMNQAIPRDRITRLLIGNVDDQVLRFPLFKDRLTIGRTSSNDIQLKAQYVSRRHAVVLTEGDTTRVIDWGSKNGVYVNSKRVTEHFLKNGDILTIGTADFRYEERAKRD